MNVAERKTLLELLAEVPDYRKGNAIKHNLHDILAIGILAIMCNANTFTGMQLFGETHKNELRKILELPHGIPSHDVFGDVFSRVDPESVGKCFELWLEGMKAELNALAEGAKTEHVIAVDGKRIRRSAHKGHKASHVVTAYVSELQLVLGQLCTDEKSNEIKAIPELLELLTIRGCIVTIDAMGTQREIAEKIIKKGGDYILALKKNQSGLLDVLQFGAEMELRDRLEEDLDVKGLHYCTIEKGHGRIEERDCWIFPGLPDEEARSQWTGLYGAALIRSTRTTVEGQSSTTDRWFIYSRKDMTAKEFLSMQRRHWAIENNLHWTLDVCFHEDNAHIRLGYAAVILNMFRKLCMQLLKADTSFKGSMQSKRLRCAWDISYALSVLFNTNLCSAARVS